MNNLFKTLLVIFCVFVAQSNAQNIIDKINIHGFVSQGYMQSTDNNYLGNTADGTFEFNEFGLNFSTEITDDLRVGIQLFARDLGYLGNDEVLIDWAYGDYRFADWFGVRAGKMKMPLGFYNEIRDVDLARTSIMLPQGVYNESWRDTFNALKGLGIYGTVPLSSFGSLDYQGQIGAMNITPRSGLNKFLEDKLYAQFTKYTQTPSYVGQLIWETPLEGFRVGGSGFWTDVSVQGKTEDTKFWRVQTIGAAMQIADAMGLPLPTSYKTAREYVDLVGIGLVQEINDVMGYWLSAEFIWGDLILAGEYYKMDSYLSTWNEELGSLRARSLNELSGYYGSIGYRFTDWFEVGSYYTEYYPDLGDKDGKGLERDFDTPAAYGYFKDLALSLRFDINPYWIVKVEGHKQKGTAVTYRQDQVEPNNVKEDWFLFAGKVTFNF